MNPDHPPDWETQARKVEVEIVPPATPLPTSNPPPQKPSVSPSSLGLQLRNWYASLPQGGKALALVACILVGFSLLKTLWQLVSALASLTLVGLALFAIYKIIIAPQSSQS